MPKYNYTFTEKFSDRKTINVCITIKSDSLEKSRSILIHHIIKMTRFGIPRIFITTKGNTFISHSNEKRADNMPFIDIDYDIFVKIQYMKPEHVFEFNHLASPFIPSSEI
jgi:hypothetical protein